MRLNKTYWLQLAAVMMLLMQAAGLHAHISVDAGAASVQGHLQLADAHIDSHTSDSEPSDDAPELLTQAAWPKHQGNMVWALPVFLAFVLLDQPAPSATPDFPHRNDRPRSVTFYQRPPTRGPPANA